MELEQLAQAFIQAKNDIDAATARKAAIAKAIADALPGTEEGATHAEAGNYKLTVSRGLKRSADTESLQVKWNDINETTRKAFRWKADVDLRNLRALEVANEAAYKQALSFITAKPAAPSVSVEIAA